MNQTHKIHVSLGRPFCIVLFCLFFSIHSSAATNHVILVMGDSLSAEYGLPRGTGWVGLLERQLKAEASSWSVFNASISGETSAGGLSRLQALLDQKKPGIVLLELGANDALRGLPIAETEGNLHKMIQMSRQSGAKLVLFGMRIPSNYGQQYTKQFSALYTSLGKQKGVVLLPFFLSGVADKPDLLQADHLHPNVEAQSILLKNVWSAMAPYQKMLKKQ